jgi:hypothetical protein
MHWLLPVSALSSKREHWQTHPRWIKLVVRDTRIGADDLAVCAFPPRFFKTDICSIRYNAEQDARYAHSHAAVQPTCYRSVMSWSRFYPRFGRDAQIWPCAIMLTADLSGLPTIRNPPSSIR